MFEDQLRLPAGQLGPLGKPKREASIREAMAWPGGPSIENKNWVTVYSEGAYEVCLGKPGKESLWEGPRQRVNDMTPTVFLHGQAMTMTRDGRTVPYTPTFMEIFASRLKTSLAGTESGEVSLVLGALLFRAAYMLDHRPPNTEKPNWHWSPPASVVEYLRSNHPLVNENGVPMPVMVYLHMLDSLALNEDVKYSTNPVDGGQTFREITDTGRTNTLKTCVNVLSLTADMDRLPKILDGFSKGRGVATITQTDAKKLFPLL